MFEHLPSDKILKKALRRGGEFADLFFESSRSTRIVCEDKKIEAFTGGTVLGAGLRVIFDLKTAYGHTNEMSSSSFSGLADYVSESVGRTPSECDIKLAKKTPVHIFLVKKPVDKVSADDKVKLVSSADKMARGLDRRIVQVRICYSDIIRHVEIAASDGNFVVNPKTLTVFSVQATASDGRRCYRGYESIGGFLGFELFDGEGVETTVRKAASRALLNLSAMRASGGPMSVVIASEAGGTMVHEAIGHGLEADLACQGLSVYEKKSGSLVASNLVSIVDDPTQPQKRGSYFFDDEGIPAERTVLVENGVLKDFMFDRLTAMKMGRKSNGHGRREDYSFRPIARMSNTMILPGKSSPDDILRSVSSGLFVKKMGGGEVNTVNGDFVFEVSEGYRIEGGKIGEPVRGATLTGNGPEVIKMIDMVGSDLGFSIGTCGKDGQEAPVSDAMPTVRIPQMVVGGEVQ